MPTSRPGYVWSGTEWVPIGPTVTTSPFWYQSSAPSTPTTGDIWIDSDDRKQYVYTGSAWVQVHNAAMGGGSDKVFFENGTTVTTNYTITSGNNAMSAGPVTINSGVTVTIPSGSVWAVI